MRLQQTAETLLGVLTVVGRGLVLPWDTLASGRDAFLSHGVSLSSRCGVDGELRGLSLLEIPGKQFERHRSPGSDPGDRACGYELCQGLGASEPLRSQPLS